jgi:uncharacterized glyoxalase superfamily protein PhnB
MFDEQGTQPGNACHGAFACDEAERTYEELSERGVWFTTVPQRQPWGTFSAF